MKDTNYKKLAKDFIIENNISDFSEAVGVVIYAYLLVIEGKEMHQYNDESKRYSYQLTDGKIGTVARCAVDRITNNILNH